MPGSHFEKYDDKWQLSLEWRKRFDKQLPEIPGEQWYQFYMVGRYDQLCQDLERACDRCHEKLRSKKA